MDNFDFLFEPYYRINFVPMAQVDRIWTLREQGINATWTTDYHDVRYASWVSLPQWLQMHGDRDQKEVLGLWRDLKNPWANPGVRVRISPDGIEEVF